MGGTVEVHRIRYVSPWSALMLISSNLTFFAFNILYKVVLPIPSKYFSKSIYICQKILYWLPILRCVVNKKSNTIFLRLPPPPFCPDLEWGRAPLQECSNSEVQSRLFLTVISGSLGHIFTQLSVCCTLLLEWVGQGEHPQNQGILKETMNCSAEQQQQQKPNQTKQTKN